MAYPKNIGELGAVNTNTGNQGVLPQDQLAFLVSEKAADNDPQMSALARAMSQSGYSNDEIFNSTGMFVDPSTNEILRNISDVNASINKDVYQKMNEQPGMLTRVLDYITGSQTQPQSVPLKTLYDHPDLYKSYPWMADIPVSAIPADERESKYNGITLQHLGSYNTLANTMQINPELNIEDQISNINHELYHGRQTKDTGQNLGGGTSNYNSFFQDLTNRYKNALQSGEISSDLSPTQLAEQHMNNYLRNHGMTEEQINSNPSYNFYQNLTGESGARLNEFVTYFSRNFPNVPITPSLLQKAMDAGYSGQFDLVPYWQQINMTDAKTMPLDPSIGSSTNIYPSKLQLAPPELMQPKYTTFTPSPEKTEPIIPTPRTGINPYTGDATPSAMNNTLPSNGGRDTSWDRPDIYSEPAGPSMDDMGEEPTGGAYSSTYNAREKRGGRIR